ncbi:LysR family transcriptional regulator [Crossiella cryophila]|uniref:DNA-binding transcriptional LysR family regulator n=1 Tax=Crossiella cryophila TaxID=43355 RepID=A0A7W7CIR9_9PSEU|nr:LysR family transcriptional regulator [Crossiella cryophila]MBB4681974.1 DNA-binding transcriptional LysR family regulator [Crossiella cryophila]
MSTRAELVALRSFLAVYRTGGVSKAADALALSQPSVSHHLRTVEAVAGRPLFVKAGRGIEPTEAGHALAAEIADHIDALERAVDALRPTGDGQAAMVFLGAPHDALAALVVPALPPVLASGLLVRCRTGLAAELVPAVLRDELDIAVLTQVGGAPTRKLYLVHFLDEEFVLVGRAGEPPYDPRQDSRPFAGYAEEMPMARRYFRECWGLRPPAPALTVPDVRAVAAAVRAGAGLAVLPRYFVEDDLAAGVLTVLHHPAKPVTNSIHLATRRGRENLPRIRAVFTALLR